MNDTERKQIKPQLLKCAKENENKGTFTGYVIVSSVCRAAVERIEELEAQIEKMKNWCNCKNYQQCLIELAEQGKGMYPSECCRNCKKWEIEIIEK